MVDDYEVRDLGHGGENRDVADRWLGAPTCIPNNDVFYRFVTNFIQLKVTAADRREAVV
jgi:hypothetical protein